MKRAMRASPIAASLRSRAPAATARRQRALKSSAKGPVIRIWSSLSRQSMTRSPPGSVTVTLRPVSPRRAAATAAAQAAVPQARVSPAPRSQVRSLKECRPGDLRERDIGALGKQRMMLEHRPEPGEIMRLDIIDEEDAMRVADIDHRRRAAAPAIDRPICSSIRPRVVRTARRAGSRSTRSAARPCRW